MAQNSFKSEKEEVSEKKVKSKKKGSAKSSKGFRLSFNGIKLFFQKEKNRQIIGLLLLVVSAYLLIAFVSFLFTWKIDQSKVEIPFWTYLFDSSILVDNWLGKLGAATSHLFIYRWFGISSFLFVGLSFISGFYVLFQIQLLPLKKTFKISLFSLFWLSIFFGYFFNDKLFYLGGGIGFQINEYLISIFGKAGQGILLFFTLIIFSIITFDIGKKLQSWLNNQLKAAEEDMVIPIGSENKESFEEAPPLDSYPIEQNNPEEESDNSIDFSISDETIDDKVSDDSVKDDSINLDPSATKGIEETSEAEETIGLEIEEPVENETTLSDKEVNKAVEDFGEYDPTLDLSDYRKPGIDLLVDHGDGQIKVNKDELEANKDRIVTTLENYNIKIQTIKATIGPTVTLYEIVPAPGVRISKIKNLEDDIALSLAALGIRIIAPIPGKGTIGIEVPNQNPDIVSMRTVIASEKFQNAKFDLPVVLGKTISNETFVFDLAKMPHLLMAGATGQGKSVGLNAILTSLLYKKHPSQLKFVLVDPKKVELTLFNKIERHFLAKLPDTEDAIITDNQKVIHTLNSLCIEMDDRYELLKTAFVRNIKEYNAKFIARKLNPENGHKYLPYIVLVIDEFADLIMTAGKEVETPIARLAQLARAIGIHLIIATQRPSTNIITGSIKANFPARIAFRVTSGIDSRTILDSGGAEQLIGRGDMLLSTGSNLIRLQCAFVDTPEVEELTEFIGSQRGYPDAFMLPEYVDENSQAAGEVDLADRDALFEDAARIVVQHQQGSASLLQRRLKLGYNRAGRIVDQLEAAGIIGPFEGSKARQVLIVDEMSLEQLLNNVDQNN